MTEDEIEQLEREVNEAGQDASRLESRLRDIPRMTDQLQHDLDDAKDRRAKALAKLRTAKPLKLPPVPTLDQMLAMARAQCPDRNPEDIKKLAAHLHACSVTGINAGENYLPPRPRPEDVTGDVRAEDDSHYNITGPPPDGMPLGIPPSQPQPPRGLLRSYA
jgi:hypothetical protein